MIMYITRHGQTDWNMEKRLQGRCDIPLNETGRQQARSCGEALRNAGIELIITSPLGRAVETAEIVREYIGDVPVFHDELLLERSFGQVEGEQIEVSKAESLPPEYGVEPKKEMVERIWTAMENYHRDYPDKTILVVTHGAILHGLLSRVARKTLEIHPAELVNAGINCIEYVDKPVLKLFNLGKDEFLTIRRGEE